MADTIREDVLICVVQRVSSARVRVGERTVAEILHGLVALVAVVREDDDGDVAYIADRLRHLRVFADAAGRMNLSVAEVDGQLLVVSQFTLAADTRRGRRPSFVAAAEPAEAERRLADLVDTLRACSIGVHTGEFGAKMKIELVNDGPVTLVLDSRDRRRPTTAEGA